MTLLIACATAAVVVFWQYSKRCTAVSVPAGLCGLAMTFLAAFAMPATTEARVSMRMFHRTQTSAVSLAMPDGAHVAFNIPQGRDWIEVRLPLSFTGVPADQVAQPEMLRVAVVAPSGLSWSSGWQSGMRTYPPPSGSTPQLQTVPMPRDMYRRLANSHVTVSGAMYFSLQRVTTLPLPIDAMTSIPGGGTCEVVAAADVRVFCRSAYREPWTTTSGFGGDIDRGAAGIERHRSELLSQEWHSPWPAGFALDPVFTGTAQCDLGCNVSLIHEEPLTWMRRYFVVRDVVLQPLEGTR
jgi:hypothetical protein